MSQDSFDPQKYYLGKLCKREHKWNNTNKSLRRINKCECLECGKGYRRNRYQEQKQDPDWLNARREKGRRYRRQKYQENPEKYRQIEKKYRDKNKEAISYRYKEKRKTDPEFALRRNQMTQDWRERNREHAREYSRLYRLKYLERYAAYEKKRYSENKEHFRLKASRYIKTSEGKIAYKKSVFRRRSFKKQNHSVSYAAADIKKRLKEFDDCCAYCGSDQRITLDHFIPISKGGPDCLGNLVPACVSCNVRKRNHDVTKWYLAQSFFGSTRFRKILRVLGKEEAEIAQLPLF